jgi:hypothetical protein
MVISKPCIHSDTAPRDGYIRGSYESVEFIREIPINKKPQKAASTTDLTSHSRNRSSSVGREAILRNAAQSHSTLGTDRAERTNIEKASVSDDDISHAEVRARGKTISFDSSRGHEAKAEQVDIPRDDESENNPIEWIMITRSDPGGSVPRFMVERGTPGGIVADASKFLNWACTKDVEDLDSDDEAFSADGGDEKAKKHEHTHHHNHSKDLHNYQTNGHLAGLEEESAETTERVPQEGPTASYSGLYGKAADAAGGAGTLIASYTAAVITEHIPGSFVTESTPPITNGSLRRDSVSTISSMSSDITFASALENRESRTIDDALSTRTTESAAETRADAPEYKELQKLEEKKRRLDEKLSKVREKENSKKSEDTAKEEEAIRKAEEKHQKEIQKQEEKYKKEVEKLEKKKEKEAQKAEERKRKAAEKGMFISQSSRILLVQIA